MSNEKLIIPPSFSLSQALELVYSIAKAQLGDILKELSQEISCVNTSQKSLKTIDLALVGILTYLIDGITQIKAKFNVIDLFHDPRSERSKVDNIKALEHDIRKTRTSLSDKLNVGHEHVSSKSHIFSNFLTRSKAIFSSHDLLATGNLQETTVRDGIDTNSEIQGIQTQRKYTKVTRNFVTEQAILMEQAVKKHIQEEVTQQLTKKYEESPRSKGSLTKNPNQNAGNERVKVNKSITNSKGPGDASERHTSLNFVESGINKAALLAWQKGGKAQQQTTKQNGHKAVKSHIPKKIYEYKKPIVNRLEVKARKQSVCVSDGVPSHRKQVDCSSHSGHTSDIGEVPGKTVALFPNQTADNGFSDIFSVHYSELDKRIETILSSLEGVNKSACQQIVNEILIVGDKVHWSDIAGLNNTKKCLKETVVYPFLRPDLFKGLREPVRGMLLFGPPGTGKTMVARAVATESNSTFFSISASSLLSKYLGESEKLVRALFYMAKRMSPSIIFIDEIDSLLTARSDTESESSRRIKTEFLIQWSSLSSATAKENAEQDESRRVLVLGATNIPWAIDDAAIRRFSKRLYIPLPQHETRYSHLQSLMALQANELTEDDFAMIAKSTEGYSGSDITMLAKEAAMEPIREVGDSIISVESCTIRGVMSKDFESAMATVKKSVSPSSLQRYEQWANIFGSAGA